jgi:hypothetical protein
MSGSLPTGCVPRLHREAFAVRHWRPLELPSRRLHQAKKTGFLRAIPQGRSLLTSASNIQRMESSTTQGRCFVADRNSSIFADRMSATIRLLKGRPTEIHGERRAGQKVKVRKIGPPSPGRRTANHHDRWVATSGNANKALSKLGYQVEESIIGVVSCNATAEPIRC